MQVQSALILLLFFYGASQASDRKRHVKIMSAGMIWDVILILQIELSRGAIAKASQALVNPILLNVHVTFAVTTVLLYGFMIYSGRQLLAGKVSKNRHKLLGMTTLTLRTLTFATSFLAVAPPTA